MHYRSLSLYLMIFSCSLSTYASIQLKFFERLKPQIEQAQYMIQLQRKHILEYSDGAPSGPIPQHIKKIAHAYHLNPKTLNTPQQWQTLKRRVDRWPVALILAQAAIESNWGRSRFALLGHNLFGLHCHTQNCGLKPKKTSAESMDQVQYFSTQQASIEHYLHTLNTHPAYSKLRHLRESMRQGHIPLSSLKLAEALTAYSEEGTAYTQRIQHLIQYYHLEDLDQ